VTATQPTRIVILGGGFAALATARHLQAAMPTDGTVEATLVSRENYLLFTPMLAEVAVGKLEPRHIAVPLREFLRRVGVWQAETVAVDLERRVVQVRHIAAGHTDELPYDHLVLALGSETTFHHVPGAAQYALPFKRLADAARIRDRVVDCFEQAAVDPHPDNRRRLLTFVVAGGGFSGVELAAALADFLREMRCYYPSLAGEPIRLVIAHHGQRLAEELSENASAYILDYFRRQRVAVRLGCGVVRVNPDSVELTPGGTIATHTVLWTAGVAPNALVAALPLPKDHHGAVMVDEHFAVQDHPGLWAIGDCAHVPNPHDGTYAPLAQNAEREGPVLANNILASLRGEPLRTFDYQLIGTFASLGTYSAVGQVFGHVFSGLPAWFLWRTVYLTKMPGINRKLRVGLDWLADIFLPADTVSTHWAAAAVSHDGAATVPTVPDSASPRPSSAATGAVPE
jgi:NADH:ubiquinone reductase (H+-translocating)